MQAETVAVVSRHALFRRLPKHAKADLLRLMQEEEVRANTLIFQEATQGNSLYLVISGGVLLQRDVDDTPALLGQLQPGESFGEIACLCPGTRMVTAKASAAGWVARLSASALAEFADKDPAAAHEIRTKILDHFMLKVRHLEPLWTALLRQGLEVLENEPLAKR